MVASIRSREYICLEFERIYVLNAAVLDAIQDGLNKNKPDRAWRLLQSYYNNSHLNQEAWAKQWGIFTAVWNHRKHSISEYNHLFNGLVNKLNQLAPLIDTKQAPTTEATQEQYLIDVSGPSDKDLSTTVSLYKKSSKTTPLSNVQAVFFEVYPVSQRRKQTN